MVNTLDWVGDGDDVSVIRSLEETFEISFSKGQLLALTDVGSLHDLVLQKISRGNDQGKCVSAMAFYRLRRALAASQPSMRIGPETDMAVFHAPSIKEFFRGLERQVGLRLGSPVRTWMGSLGYACLLLPFMVLLPLLAIGGFVPLPPYMWVGWLLVPAGLLLLRLDPGRLTGTVGDLARRAARLNYGRLMKQGARGREAEIWNLFVEILADESRLMPKDITRETVFFRSQIQAA